VTIETSRPEQGRIQDFRTVGGGHEDDAGPGVEAVHLDEELVEGLFPFVMATGNTDAAGLAQGVKLVDEDDAGGLLLGLFEEIPHPGGPHADEHLHEVGAAHAEERHTTLAGNGLCQEGFPRSGGAHEEDPLGDLPAQGGEFFRRFKEIDDLHELLLRLVDTGDVVEGDVQLVFHVDLRLVFPQAQEPGLLAAHALHEEIPNADEEQDGQDPGEEVPEKGRFDFALEDHRVFFQHGGEFLVDTDGLEGLRVTGLPVVYLHLALDLIGGDGNFRDLAVPQQVEKLAVGNGLYRKHGGDVALDDEDQPHANQDIPEGKTVFLFHGGLLVCLYDWFINEKSHLSQGEYGPSLRRWGLLTCRGGVQGGIVAAGDWMPHLGSPSLEAGTGQRSPRRLKKGRSKILMGILFLVACLFFPPAIASCGGETPTMTYRVVRTYPHDRHAFTQGLAYVDGVLYEGTGLHGRSSLRRVDLASGRVLYRHDLDRGHFGEGITVLGQRIIQLTWRSRTGFVYDRSTLRRIGRFTYDHEGWGIAHDGRRLFVSDGTPTLRILDPASFRETGRIQVHDERGPVGGLNELEYVRGFLYANLWPTNTVAVVSPRTGRVHAKIDLSGLLSDMDAAGVDVLNGIAYDASGNRLFVTGKFWPKIFEIETPPIATRSR
jgi:glutamine cyclotransferase